MKKKLALILALTMTAALFSGCGGGNGGNKKIEEMLKEIDLTADSEYAGELNIRTWSEETEVLMMNSLISAFNEKYPYIRINYEQDYLDNYYSALTGDFGVAVQQNDFSDVPDIFWMSQDKIDSFYDLDDIMFPLSEIDKIDDSFTSDVLVEEALLTCKVNDCMYILPREFNQVVMYFNEEIFDAAGVSYPTAQMSQSAFLQMCADLKAGLKNCTELNDYGVPYKDAVTYLVDVNAQWDSWVWPLVKSFNGEIVSEEGEAVMNSEEVYNAIDFWKTMCKNEYAGPINTQNVGVNFRMQQAAIYFHTRNVMSNIYTSTKQIKGVQKLGVTSLPQFGDSYAVGSGASGYSMYMNSEHKTEAWLFLKFIASEEGQNILGATGNGIPAVKSMLTDENASWRTFTHEAFGDAFDNNAFIYGMDLETSPYCSTRDFFQYVPIAQQSNVLQCLNSAFIVIDSENNSEQQIRSALQTQNDLIDYYLHRS